MTRARAEADARLEELAILTERLTGLVRREIGHIRAHQMTDVAALAEERATLSAHYGRTVALCRKDKEAMRQGAPERREGLKRATGALRLALEEWADTLGRVRRVSEGLVRAIAEEVSAGREAPIGYGKSAAPARAYAKRPAPLALNHVV